MADRMSEKTTENAVKWCGNAFLLALGWLLSRHYSLGKFALILVGCAVFAFAVGFVRGMAGVLSEEK